MLLADLPPGSFGPFAVGVLAAAASGFVAIDALLGYVRGATIRRSCSTASPSALFVAGLIASGVRDSTF